MTLRLSTRTRRKGGDEQFLVDDDGQHGNDAADGEGTGVAHEYLGG